MQLLVLTSCFLLSFLGNRSCQTSSLNNMQKQSGILPLNNGGMDDLESFQACLEEIKRDMSQGDPSISVVLGEIVSSTQPIAEGDIFQIFQSILNERQKIRVLPAEKVRTKFLEKKGSSASAY